jgi:hypothetical protein
MKLTENTIISREKITKYLLVEKKRNDKSKWLSTAGYTLENWERLAEDIRRLLLSKKAAPEENSEYGQRYIIRGQLKGPNGSLLPVCTIWMTEYDSGNTKFITMYPDKEANKNEI